jgi:TIR domain
MPSVFISYSHKDEVWKDRLAKQLDVLNKQGLLDVWEDRQIGAGAEWLKEIEAAIERASLAVLLVSADFLTSPFILGKEVPRLLERRSAEGLEIFPILVRPCVWQEVPWLASIQARPLDSRPLNSFKGSWEAELVKIAREVLQITRSHRSGRNPR